MKDKNEIVKDFAQMVKTEGLNRKGIEKVLSECFDVVSDEEFLKCMTNKLEVKLVENINIVFNSCETYCDAIDYLDKKHCIKNIAGVPYDYKECIEGYYTEECIQEEADQDCNVLPILISKKSYEHSNKNPDDYKECMSYNLNRLGWVIFDATHGDENSNLYVWDENTISKLQQLENDLIIKEEQLTFKKNKKIENLLKQYNLTLKEFDELNNNVYEVKREFEKLGIRY